jgi:hypothetical protein
MRMELRCFGFMMMGMNAVAMRRMRVMGCFLVVTRMTVFCRFAMMAGGMFVMFRSLRMMFMSRVRHELLLLKI